MEPFDLRTDLGYNLFRHLGIVMSAANYKHTGTRFSHTNQTLARQHSQSQQFSRAQHDRGESGSEDTVWAQDVTLDITSARACFLLSL